MSAPAIALLADFDRDGVFEADLTTRISSVAGGRINIQAGMTEGGKYRIGAMTAVLNNDDGAFTPEYTSGTYYGQLDDPGIPLKVQAVHNSITYVLFAGYAVTWEVEVGPPGENTVTVQAEDAGTYLARRGQVNVSMATDRDESEAIQAILTAAGFTSSDWDLDSGLTALPYHFESNADAMEAVGAASASGLGGHFFVNGAGAFRYENRNSRLGPSHYFREIQRDSPVMHLRLRESTGSTVYDHTANAHNGTLQGSPTLGATGLVSADGATALDLEAGSSQYVTVADHANLDVGDTFTFRFRIKPESIGSLMTLVSKGANGPLITVTAAGKVELGKQGVGAIAASTSVLAAGTTYDVMVAKNGASSTKIYIDGVDVTDTVTDRTVASTATNLYIGSNSTPADYFEGVIQDFALYSTAKSATRAMAHHLAAVCGYWGDSSSVTPCVPPRYDRGLDEMVSRVTCTGRYFREGQEIEIARDPRADNPFDPLDVSTLSLTAGQVLIEDLVIPGALVSIVTPVANVDYLANTANDGSGADRTSSLGVTLTQLAAGVLRRKLVNNHASDTIYVTLFRIRATPLQLLTEVAQTVVDEDAPSGQPAKQEVSMAIPWVSDDTKLRDFAVQVYETYSWPYPRLSLQFAWEDDATIRDMLWLDTGYLVRFHDRASAQWGTYVKDTWYVGKWAHAIEPGGQSYTTVTLHPSWLYRKLDAVAWDDFDRADAVGDLGKARSDDTWAGDTGWDIVSNEAVPNTDAETFPYIDLGGANHDQAIGFDFGSLETNELSEENWDVETGTGGWAAVGGATMTRSTEQAKHGSYSLKVVTTAAAYDGIKISGLTWSNSERLALGFWVYGTAGQEVRPAIYSASGTLIQYDVPEVGITLAATGWNYVSIAGVAGSAAAGNGEIYIDTGSVAQVVTWYVDLIVFLRGSLATKAGVQFRRVDDSNNLRLVVQPSRSQVVFEEEVGGVVTELAAVFWEPAATIRGRVFAQGDRVRAWVERKLVVDQTETSLNYATAAGLYSDDANGDVHARRWYAQAL